MLGYNTPMNRRGFLKTAAFATAGAAMAAGQESLSRMNENGNEVSLAGAWAFRKDTGNVGEAGGWATKLAVGEGWTEATVPGCWEKDGQPGTLTGPVWYRRDVPVPANFRAPGAARRVWWEHDAVSYHADGWANGAKVGEHTGLWDAFAWEIPPAALKNNVLALALRVEKPGGKRFPVRETLAGFLPYVWGTWGGPWQDCRLRATGPAAIHRIFAPGKGDGTVKAEADVDVLPGTQVIVRFDLRDEAGKSVAGQEVRAAQTGTVMANLRVPNAVRWEPERPALYTLTVTAFVGGQVSDMRARNVGFRDVSARGETLLLNGRSLFFRAPLSWGWYEETRAPNPPPAVFEDELKRVRALGFNGMKLCLWVPPPAYFDIADRLGMLLWVELPLWLPQGTDFCRKQTPLEYARIVRQIGDHPSIAVWTLGCEIGQGVDADFLGALYAQVKEQTKSGLVRDNSGSAECYGGPLPEHADYFDYHLYCDLPFARPTFDSFAPRWRNPQPYLFGEYADQDALRDLPGLIKTRNGAVPWWAKDDKEFNPVGVRWEYGAALQTERMKASGLLGRLDDLREGSRKQALLTRKTTLELTRSYPFMSGYVVTGLADTPISTAGLFDDFGASRFTPDEFRPFNDDTVLFLEPDRRRAWTAGGDRPSFLDRWNVWAGASVRRLAGVSHFGHESGAARLTWTVTGGGANLSGALALSDLTPGTLRELGLIEFAAPIVTRPQKLTLTLTLDLPGGSGRRVTNSWPLWVFPKLIKDEKRRISLFDPAGHLTGFADAVGLMPVSLRAATGESDDGGGPVPLIVATAWRPEMLGYVRAGGRLLLVQPGASAENTGDGLPADALPFWREAMKLFDRHAAWGQFPHDDWTDLNFYGLAADAAFDLQKVVAALGPDARLSRLLTRVDARSFALGGYLLSAEMGGGKLLMTTLRPQGGLGDQPSGLARHVAGAYLLRTWLDWLAV